MASIEIMSDKETEHLAFLRERVASNIIIIKNSLSKLINQTAEKTHKMYQGEPYTKEDCVLMLQNLASMQDDLEMLERQIDLIEEGLN